MTNTNTKIFAIAKIQNDLLCYENTLGHSFEIKIASHCGRMHLPTKPPINIDVDISPPLLPPNLAKKWKNVGKHDYSAWGNLKLSKKRFGAVKRILFEFSFEENNKVEYCKDIYNEINHWAVLFENYVQLFIKQNTVNHVYVSNNSPWIVDLIEDNVKGLIGINNNSQVINIVARYGENSLTFEQISEICVLTSKGIAPKIEYLLLLESYNSLKSRDYRNVIIEATSALEISIVSRILHEFNLLNLSFGDNLLKKYSGLGRKFELLKLLSIEIPVQNYKDLILRPRNEVVHKAEFPSANDARQALKNIELIIKEFTPVIHEDII